jgi:hypothetical protein
VGFMLEWGSISNAFLRPTKQILEHAMAVT